MPIFRDRPELLKRFRAGEHDALEEIYRTYVDRVALIFRFGFRVAGTHVNVVGLTRRPTEIADAVQEVFLRSFAERARLSYDGKREYGPFLYSIARNLLVDILRRSDHEVPVGVAVAVDDGALPGPAALPESWADASTVAIVRRYLSGLDDELRRVHDALYVDGLSQRLAADRLQVSRQMLRTLQGRLREGLRRELERDARRAV